ncbi:MAG: DUF3789 domain-containing protein [Candidatus Cloacimonetes bacterium]|nr:DUF3789 domain-containing protein [Candidatus Cloacimonadota bacterium]
MVAWYWVLIALFVGAGIGLLTTALCVAAKNGDRHISYYGYDNNNDYRIDNVKYY